MAYVMISQPMFLPWAGLFDAIRLCDILVHYDDVQMPQGRSLMNRVQVKAADQVHWLTAPILRGENRRIDRSSFDDAQPWRERHLTTLRHALAHYKFGADALAVATSQYREQSTAPRGTLADFNIGFIERILPEFGIDIPTLRSSDLGIDGSSSERLLAIVKYVGGSTYLTGHGAARYLDHTLFEKAGVKVRYMRYDIAPYFQKGDFTPFVTVLDLLASAGPSARLHLRSSTVPWQDFVSSQELQRGSE